MNFTKYPYICYFPTTNVFIDDSKEYLESLYPILSANKNNIYKFFSNSSDAIEFIKKNVTNNQWYKKYINAQENQNINQQAYNVTRFSIITNVFIDYNMPGLNGLEVAHELSNLGIRKVLLTGAADQETVIRAFNENLIDGYIRKDNELINEKIIKSINKGNNIYFEKIDTVRLNINDEDFKFKEIERIKKNKEFIDLFNNLIKEHNIIEFYEVEKDLCYLFLDVNAKPFMFYFYSENYLDEFYEFAKEEGLSKRILSELKNKTKMFCFDEHLNFFNIKSLKECENNLVQTSAILINNKKYFFSIKDKNIDKKIIPFINFIHEVQNEK